MVEKRQIQPLFVTQPYKKARMPDHTIFHTRFNFGLAYKSANRFIVPVLPQVVLHLLSP